MQHHCTQPRHVPAAVCIRVLYLHLHIFFLTSVRRLWGFSLASACSCWLPPRSSFWPLPLCSAASASAAKATTTHCQLKHDVRTGAESRFKDGPSFFPFFNPFTFSSSHQLWALHIFWAEPAPAPAASGSIALHERGMVEKRPCTLAWRQVQGERSEEVRLVYGPLCPCVVRRDLRTWRKSGPLQVVLSLGLLRGGVFGGHNKQRKNPSSEMLFSCMDNIMQEPR